MVVRPGAQAAEALAAVASAVENPAETVGAVWEHLDAGDAAALAAHMTVNTAAEALAARGLPLVHFSASREHFLSAILVYFSA